MLVKNPKKFFLKKETTQELILKCKGKREGLLKKKVRGFAVLCIETNLKTIAIKILWHWHKYQRPNMLMDNSSDTEPCVDN
jgi:hypothetical protein